MSRYLLLLLLSTVIISTVKGQDTLVLDNERLIVKVTKVSLEDITYKKWSNLDGPEYVISKDDVQVIKYRNGEKDVFNGETFPTPLRKNAVFVGFGGLNYLISINYERKILFTKSMNFFIIKGGIGYFPGTFFGISENKNIFTFASSAAFNLRMDKNNSLELGAGVGYYALQNSHGYTYVSPIFGYRKEAGNGVLFKFYMSMLTVNQSLYDGNYNLKYYPFIGIDIGAVF